ncbi:MAG: hypothetical protein HYX29_03100 [Solirubrobacterales bacterium]|nr:hypothetical protein [Solirubrobacterales bacterium]
MFERIKNLLRPHVGPLLVAVALSALYFILDLRGGDLAAHLYRAELVKNDGFFVWNYNWYGGHYVVSYGVIFPTLSSTIGVRLSGALAYVLGVLLFSILAREVFPPRGGRAAAYVFSVVFSATLVIGQLPYALALAIGLGALIAAAHGRSWVAAFLALNCALTSPLAALFISFIAFTVWLGGHPWETLRTARHAIRAVWKSPNHAYLAVAVATVLPAMLVSFLFPEGGSQPFVFASYLGAIAFTVFFWVMVRDELSGDARRMLGTGVVLYVIFLTANELIPSPIGGNAIRLGMVLFPTLAAAALWPRSGRYALAVIVPLLGWQGATALWAIVTSDATSDPYYFAPVNRFLDAKNKARDEKVEVVFTRNHFEAAYVANRRPIARGWERQLDTKYNALFYDGTLNPRTYARWLIDNDVRWVALPKSATLDYSGRDEAQLIRDGLPYLDDAADFKNWEIYRVTLPDSSTSEPNFRDNDPTKGFSIKPDGWGITETKIRWQRFLRPSYGCLRGSDDGYLEVVLPSLGSKDAGGVSSVPPVVSITSDFSLGRLVGGGYVCAEGWTTDENGDPIRSPKKSGRTI